MHKVFLPIKNNLNQNTHENPVLDQSTGGTIKRNENLKNQKGQLQINFQTPITGEDPVELAYEIKKATVCYPHFDPKNAHGHKILNPATTSFTDIERWAKENDYAQSTIKSRMGLLRKMEVHPTCPVNFKDPSWQNFFDYMDAVKCVGDTDKSGNLRPIGKNGQCNRIKAWYLCTEAWGVSDIWPKYKVKKVPNRVRPIVIPSPEDVRRFLTFKYVKNRILNRYIQYLFFFGFMIGLAPEKEWVLLNVSDLAFNANGSCTLTATRWKVNSNTRALPVEKTIATSPVHKSLKNYIHHVRPKFAQKDEKALFVNPKTGKRWSEDELRHFLTSYGKTVYQGFYPYLMRHWSATARLIEWRSDQFSLAKLSYWLGHEKLDQTKDYVDLASLFNKDNGSWLSRALKQGSLGGLHVSPDFARHSSKKANVEHPFSYKLKRTWRDSNPRSIA